MQGAQAERHQSRSEAEHLLSGDSMEMGDLSPQQTREDKKTSQLEERYTDLQSNGEASGSRPSGAGEEEFAPINGGRMEYRVYKIRWFGLTQLILLNIVVSWDVSTTHSSPVLTVQLDSSMTNNYNAVALLLRRRQHRRRLLLYKPKHHQLAIHRLPLRLCRRLPSYDLDSAYRWPPPRNHHSGHSYPTRKLDTICGHAHLTSKLRPYDVRSDPHRSGATLRALSTHSVLRHLVHALRPRFCYRDRFACKPFRWRAGTTHQPVPSK